MTDKEELEILREHVQAWKETWYNFEPDRLLQRARNIKLAKDMQEVILIARCINRENPSERIDSQCKKIEELAKAYTKRDYKFILP